MKKIVAPVLVRLFDIFYFWFVILLVIAILLRASSAITDPRFVFLLFYLGLGFIMEFGRRWWMDVSDPLDGTVQMLLATVCWPLLPIFRSRRIRKYGAGRIVQHRLVVLKRIALAFLFVVSLLWLKEEVAWSWREFYVCLLIIYSLGLYLLTGIEEAIELWRSDLKFQQSKAIFLLASICEMLLMAGAWPIIRPWISKVNRWPIPSNW